ncbi:NB-ARC domain protein (plasmid) [Klebsiella michiganensis]|uniref:NB-ARC domain protein n=1 Tax=Klebsiella michiganensis TaxID=1134687 RepID=UPI0021D994F0|nr:NB-ARC domain protein [Klebsiella michiganensis]UYB60158.1 NB-ARC domain protein [Klebsiella michiganensis]
MEKSHDLKFNNNQYEKCLNKVLSYYSEKDTNLIVVIIGPSGSGKTLLAKRALIDGLLISPDELIASEEFIRSLSNKDIIIDDVFLFDIRNVLKYVHRSLASGRKVILTGRPEDESLYQQLLFNLPKKISPLFIKLAGENSLYL